MIPPSSSISSRRSFENAGTHINSNFSENAGNSVLKAEVRIEYLNSKIYPIMG
ncbi:hypothetical protein LEP1GSC171_3344 [Leptospira santarosai str. HAI1380]|uniref:Uncharacterized protein n=3 Tax=Leptospira santarosai TaxID=28183 RepID=M6UJQ3_9LEPT|nr:hypothetical protein LEP1GSC179_4185 [Leptospira santarosai str. MOR084]EKO80251.1 hypothetical protein LEP1GSC068_1044 [Leptospira sp. Fiocruz LV3954]EMF91350.1 hypothetical protein LEP1GSC005_2795 [Leptospira santarosai str. ST188]EMI67776.1 hypothetical protein LEP1GSC076_0888 [Leptospira sp. Fiocruz LV4135]EMN21501.1 hypothetical protein LEP1GSC063_4051 [Leptospira santarosai serovar Arenal str. MAVJ 401]EMO30629.1 hypothetical protein LEP1GSC175_3728 [Leptospira santarosai str. HAI821]